MSLENAIQELTTEVRALRELTLRHLISLPDEELGKGEKGKAAAKTEKAEKTEKKTKAPTYTLDDVKKKALEWSNDATRGRKLALALLAKFGVKATKELKESDYAEFMILANQEPAAIWDEDELAEILAEEEV